MRRLRARVREVQAPTDLPTSLTYLCRVAEEELSAWGVAVTLMAEGADGTLAMTLAVASHAAAGEVDDLHFALGEGPAHEAHLLGRPVLVADLEAEVGQWPGFARAALESGVAAAFSYPLGIGAAQFGALTVYATQPTTRHLEEVGRALLLADLAIEVLLDSATYDTDNGAGGPTGGQDERYEFDAFELADVVYQAQGMVMMHLGVSLAEALIRLRAHAFGSELELSELATQVVSGQARLPGSPRQ